MKKLDVQARLQYARSAVAVLRALHIVDRTMGYKELGLAVGLISDNERWEPWHRQQTADILDVASAVENKAGATDTRPLEFDRIINEREGKPGKGIAKKSRLIKG
jgi:hypothetical protein